MRKLRYLDWIETSKSLVEYIQEVDSLTLDSSADFILKFRCLLSFEVLGSYKLELTKAPPLEGSA